jgi:hypothetical protein
MIDELINCLEKLVNYGQENDTTIKFHVKVSMNELMDKYNNLTKVDKLSLAV